MEITNNFTLEEFVASSTAYRLHIDNAPSQSVKNNISRLAREILQPLRDKFKKPIKITSGYRCPELNKAVNGSKTSQHLYGEAADINIGLADNRRLFELAQQMIKDGQIVVGQLINERNYSWIHISLPNSKHKNQILHL